MTSYLVSYVSGVVFAVGLVVGGMNRPSKVIGFLDISGNWDPSLILVMGGAMAVYMLAYWIVRPRATMLQASQTALPSRRDIDVPLLAGAAVFGLGWGLGGLCPGPALTGIGSGQSSILLFSGGMLIGMFVSQSLASFRGWPIMTKVLYSSRS